jgi:hypothetical protein
VILLAVAGLGISLDPGSSIRGLVEAGRLRGIRKADKAAGAFASARALSATMLGFDGVNPGSAGDGKVNKL